MTTTMERTDAVRPDQYLYLEDVSWECYEMLVSAASERHLQITYNQGRMEIISPLPRHERAKTLIGAMIQIIAIERDIDICSLGSTTFRRQLLKKGLEPDECYYVQNENKVWDKDNLDLDLEPPPDLALEVETTSRIIKRLRIYASLKVPEVWRHDGLRLVGLKLMGSQYEPIEMSLAFPFLKVDDLNQFLDQWLTLRETKLLREFRDWVRKEM